MLQKNNSKLELPFVGIVGRDGYIESYDFKTAKKYDFHHSHALSRRGVALYHRDDTLRFVRYEGENKYTLEGAPALEPFGSGRRQVRQFAKHVIKNGAPDSTPVVVADHHLNTEWEGECIGTVSDLL